MGRIIYTDGDVFNSYKLNNINKTGYLTYIQGDLHSYLFIDGWSGYRNVYGDVAGTIPSNAPKIEIGLMGIPTTANQNVIFGHTMDEHNTMIPCIYTLGNNKRLYSQGRGAQFNNGAIADTSYQLHVLIYGVDKSYLDGEVISDNMDMSNYYTLSNYDRDGITLFGGVYGYSANAHFIMGNARVQYVKLYTGDTLVHDLRAYLKNGIPCMKDEVTGEYYYNQGDGEFGFGEVI